MDFDFFTPLLDFVQSIFFDPTKRVFIGYLVSAWLIAMMWLMLWQAHNLKAAFGKVFSRAVWWSASARTDYGLLIVNRIVLSLFSPVLISQLVIATFWFEFLHHGTTPGSGSGWPVWAVMGLFTVVLFLLDDASRYWMHRWLHQIPFLWCFHRVHHTATTLTPLTIFRTHPVEGVIFTLRSAVIQGFCMGLFVFFFGSKVDLVSVLGANVFLFFLNVLGANLRHSTIQLPYPHYLERWLISPAQHQIHHSLAERHFDKNFGVFLAIWDRWAGTLHHSEREPVQFGIKGEQGGQTLWRVYWQPLRESMMWFVNKSGLMQQKR